MRGTGESDVPLGTDYEGGLKKWDEIHNRKPRITGTLEEAFGRWEAEALPLYDNRETRKGYSKRLRHIRPIFDPMTGESIELVHLKGYLKRRTAKTQGNREMALLSVIGNWARGEGLTSMPGPATGMERSKWKNKENARHLEVTDPLFEAVYAEGDQVLKECMDIATATGMRLTDVRNITMPAGDMLTLKASKTGKAADYDVSVSSVLPELIWEAARAEAVAKAKEAGDRALAVAIRATFLRDMRKRAADLAEDMEGASKLLQHSSTKITARHYRTKATKLKPVR